MNDKTQNRPTAVRVALAVSAAALALIGVAPGAASAAPAQEGLGTTGPCGFFYANGNGYYRHCGSDSARVVKKGVAPGLPTTDCVGPWETAYLGLFPIEVAGAHYVGSC